MKSPTRVESHKKQSRPHQIGNLIKSFTFILEAGSHPIKSLLPKEGQGAPNAELNQGTEGMRDTVLLKNLAAAIALSSTNCILSLQALAAGGKDFPRR